MFVLLLLFYCIIKIKNVFHLFTFWNEIKNVLFFFIHIVRDRIPDVLDELVTYYFFPESARKNFNSHKSIELINNDFKNRLLKIFNFQRISYIRLSYLVSRDWRPRRGQWNSRWRRSRAKPTATRLCFFFFKYFLLLFVSHTPPDRLRILL